MVKILNGILGNENKAKYDTLSNLTKIAGKNNLFMPAMAEAVVKFTTVAKILHDMETVEH
jgi:hypothetical protein